MIPRNFLTTLLSGRADVDFLASADRWVDESLTQIDFDEEPTLIEFLASDPQAHNAFRATLQAINNEITKGQRANNEHIEILVSRLIAACCHKAIVLERKANQMYKGLA